MLILDESVAALDPLVKKQILQLLKKIQQESGMVYLFVTHELDVAESIANKYLMIAKGQIVYMGPSMSSDELKKTYLKEEEQIKYQFLLWYYREEPLRLEVFIPLQ